MTNKKNHNLNSFGQLLKLLRKRGGLSQLRLAEQADTTARYVSFIETGRSRPGREVVLRISKALDLTAREHSLLLSSAGIPAQGILHERAQEVDTEFLSSVQTVLDDHAPNPAYASDTHRKIVLTNRSFRTLLPGVDNLTPEETISIVFGSKKTRKLIVNWAEVAWIFLDRCLVDATLNPDLQKNELTERALGYMKGIERPSITSGVRENALNITFQVNGQHLRTFMTSMRYENIADTGFGNLRVERFFPVDEQTKAAFSAL